MRTHYEVWSPDTRVSYPGMRARSWYDNDAPHYIRAYADKGQAMAAARRYGEQNSLPFYQVRRIAGRKPTPHFEGKSTRYWKP